MTSSAPTNPSSARCGAPVKANALAAVEMPTPGSVTWLAPTPTTAAVVEPAVTTDTVMESSPSPRARAARDTSFETAHVRHVRFAKNRLAHSFAKSQCVEIGISLLPIPRRWCTRNVWQRATWRLPPKVTIQPER